MMKRSETAQRPRTLKDVAAESNTLAEFGRSLRDWQHEIQRGGIHSRREFSKRLAEPPALLTLQFADGDIADAYLAAYAEWLAHLASIDCPEWCNSKSRCIENPWYSSAPHSLLKKEAPEPFKRRNLFTIPQPVFTPRRGRPPVSSGQKRHKAIIRQRAYRARIRQLVAQARALNQHR